MGAFAVAVENHMTPFLYVLRYFSHAKTISVPLFEMFLPNSPRYSVNYHSGLKKTREQGPIHFLNSELLLINFLLKRLIKH